MTRPLLEVCVDTAAGLDAAVAGGADRIELCAALDLGGLTPTPGLIAHARTSPVPVYAMIRPRSGDFVFDAQDIRAMRDDIHAMRDAGLAGVVLGASLPDGQLDQATLEILCTAARGLGTTLHRAFDLAPDFDSALETAIDLGFERVLTSGGALTAPVVVEIIARMHMRAQRRIVVMPGSGVNATTVSELFAHARFAEVHASCARVTPTHGDAAQRLGFAQSERRYTSSDEVRKLRSALDGIVPSELV